MASHAHAQIETVAWSSQGPVGASFGAVAARKMVAILDATRMRSGPEVAEQLDRILPDIMRRDGIAQHIGDFLDLLQEVPALGRNEAAGLAASLAHLTARLDVPALRRWIITGLRAYERDPAQLLAYFRLEDPLAARSLVHEQSNLRFDALKDCLQYYVDGLLGKHLKLEGRPSGALHGPPLRPVVAEGGLFLPDGYTVLDSGGDGALYRAACAHAIAHLQFSPRHLPTKDLKPMLVAVIGLVEDARVEYLMMRQLPGLKGLWRRFHDATDFADRLSFADLAGRLARALNDPEHGDDNYWVNKGVRLFQEQLGNPADYASFRRIASILANDLGQMRVRFLPEAYVPTPSYRDDNSCLWDFGEPRTPPPPQEPLHLDAVRIEQEKSEPPSDNGADSPVPAAATPVDGQRRFDYPEWDYQAAVERAAWATVIEQPRTPGSVVAPQTAPAPQTHRNLFSLIKARQLSRSTKLVRQWEGEELDLNAAVAARVDMRSGVPPDPRVFKRPGRRTIESAILVLLDTSESTNDCLPGRFDSVLDAIRDASLKLGAAMAVARQKFAIHAFCSNGRQAVSYFRVKDFSDSFGAAEQARVRALKGAWSTRMGAALRHAQTMLDEQPCERRILLLVTDGEPSDVDVKDPNYLIEDTARAVRVITGEGTIPFCLTVDKKAEHYVARVFGDRYLLLENPQDLVAQLSHVFVRLLSR